MKHTHDTLQDTRKLHDVFMLSLKNPELFREVVIELQAPFIRKAMSVLGNKEDARDVVQETFVRMYASGKTYKAQQGAVFTSWAYKILLNQCYTMLKKNQAQKARVLHLEEEWEEIIADTEEIAYRNLQSTKEYVLSLVSRVPQKLRTFLHMHYIEDIPQEEIALREGVSHSVVRTRLSRARTYLLQLMNHDEKLR